MAGTVLAPQAASDLGIIPGFVASAVQMELPNTGAFSLLHVKCNSSGGVNVTFTNQTGSEGRANPDLVVAVAVSTEKIIGPFPKGLYNMGNGNVQVAINTPANCTVAAYSG